MAGRRVAVLGDVQGELIAAVPGLRFADATTDVLRFTPLTMVVGGTAANFARAAVPYFAEVHLFGRVGTDPMAPVIRAGLDTAGVHAHLIRDPGRPSGMAVVVRDGDPAVPHGNRLLLVRAGSANTGLTTAELADHKPLLAGMDALVVDGYATLTEPRRSACLDAMRLVESTGGAVLFDVVPHDSYRRYDLAELRRLTASATIVVGEVRTLCGFFGVQIDKGGCDLSRVRALLPTLVAEFGDRALFLRFGLGDIDESLRVMCGAPARYRHTGYQDTSEPTGFGDRLTAAELAEYLADAVRAAATDGPDR
jgi:sugar/nucleoside kinase (ribokinase family)